MTTLPCLDVGTKCQYINFTNFKGHLLPPPLPPLEVFRKFICFGERKRPFVQLQFAQSGILYRKSLNYLVILELTSFLRAFGLRFPNDIMLYGA